MLLLIFSCKSICLGMKTNKDLTNFKISCGKYYLTESEVIFLEKNASAGDLIAAYKLSQYYYLCGVGNHYKYIKWLKTVASAGCASSQYQLGVKLFQNNEIKEGLSWIEKSAQSGYPPAQYTLGGLYEAGKYIKKNENEAFSLYKKASFQGEICSMEELINCFSLGKGTQKSLINAYLWSMILSSKVDIESNEGKKIIKTKTELLTKISIEDQKKATEEYNDLIKTINENEKNALQYKNCFQSP